MHHNTPSGWQLRPGSYASAHGLCGLTRPLAARPYAQTLYESSVAFGLRKALLGEQGKGDMAARIDVLEGRERDLGRQVADWRARCEAVEKREAERREAEVKKHKEEVAYLEQYARQLKSQLEAVTSVAGRKAPGTAAS